MFKRILMTALTALAPLVGLLAPFHSAYAQTTEASQTINFATIPNQLVGPYPYYSSTPFSISAAASSGLTVSFTSSSASVCTVSGTTVTLVSPGACVITANQRGNANYTAAPAVTQTFEVGTSKQTISFPTIATQTYSLTGKFAPSATSSSGLAVTFTSSTNSVCQIDGPYELLIIGGGTCTITANQVGNTTYLPAQPVTQSFTIVPTTQTITFSTITDPYVAALQSTWQIAAVASSNLEVTFVSQTPSVCTLSNPTTSTFGSTASLITATFLSPGTCTITANQAGNNNYTAAPQVTESFTYQATQTINFAALPNLTYGAAPFTVSATATSGLPVSIVSAQPSVCTVSGSTVTIIGSGTCTIVAEQDGNSSFAAAQEVQQAFAVATGSQTINFPTIANQIYGVAPLTISATSSAGLPVALKSSTPAVCTISGSTVTLTGIGTCTIAANQSGVNNQYTAAPQVTQSFTVSDSGQTIAFAALPSKVIGTAPFTISVSASSNLPVTLTSSTTSVCTVSGSTVSLIAPGTCAINANQAGNADYNAATQVTQSFVVMATQTINFAALPTPYTGNLQATVNLNANASSSLPVSFTSATPAICTVSGNIATVVAVGTCTIDANQAGNAIYTAAPQVAQSFVVSALSQTINFAALTGQTIGAAPFSVSVTASSTLPVVLTSATPSTCTVSNSIVTVVAVGTCTIDANQSGNSNYAAAPQVAQTFNVALVNQSITFGSLANQIYGATPITLAATASSNLPVTFTTSTANVCMVSGATLSLIAGGTCIVNANQAGDGVTYGAAPQVAQSFTVADASQAITFGNLSNQTYGAAPLTLTASSSANLPIIFSSTTPSVCTVSGSTLTLVSAGTCSVNADQPGNSDYSAATTVTQAFTISSESQSINFGSLANQTYGVAPITLSATASSGLPVVFSTITQAVCTVSGNTLTIVGTGTCAIYADQSGNSGYAAAPTATQSFTVTPANQTITFGGLANQTYGVAPISLTATSSSGLPVLYSSTTQTVCTVSGNTLTINAGGLCSINADQSGNGGYNAAATVTQTFTIADASQSISFPLIPAQNMGEAPFALNATSSANLPITFSTSTPTVCSISGQMVIIDAIGTCTVTASQIGNNDYGAATAVTQSFSVVASTAQSTTTLTASVNPVQRTQSETLTATVTGNNPTGSVTFMSGGQPLGTASVSNGQAAYTFTVGASGVQNITAVYSGDTNNPGSTSAVLALNELFYNLVLTNPSNGDIYSGSSNVFFRVQTSGTIGNVSVSFYVNGKNYTATPDNTPGGYYANVSLPVSSSQYFTFATVTDDGGNMTRESEEVNFSLVAASATELTIATPTVSGTTINMSATATQVVGATVQFFANGQQITSGTSAAANSNGTWTYSWTNVPAGVYSISAQLVSSSGTVLGQQTSAGAVTVGGPSSGTTLSASSTSVTTNQSLTLTAIVYGNNPTGTVTFTDNGTTLGSGTVAYGSATLTTKLSTVGANNIIAAYSGDANNISTTSSAIAVQATAPVLQSQTITFPAIQNQMVGAAPINLSATSSSGLPVSFTYFPTWQCSSSGTQCQVVPGPCSVSGNTLTIQAVGSCQLQAYNSGSATYAAAAVTQTITIGTTMPTVTMTVPSNGAAYVAQYSAIATPTAAVQVAGSATAGAGTTISTIGVLIDGTIYGGMAPGFTENNAVSVPPGTHTIQIQATDALGNTNTSPSVSITVTENNGGQTISFATIPAQTMGVAPFTVAVTSTSGLPVTLTSGTTSVCTVSGSTVTVLAVGTCTITANQSGNASYTPATAVQQSFVVTNSSGASPGGGGTITTPTVTLSASGNNARMSGSTPATITFNYTASEAGGQIVSLTLYQNTGNGYGTTPVWSGSGTAAAPQLNLTAGTYLFELIATDANNNSATSTPVVVNVTSSSLLGQVRGIEVTSTGDPQLFGWVCQNGNTAGLSYQVYLNAPSNLGGALLTSGTANVSGQPDDITVQANCGTTGSSHDFTVDLSSYTSQYGGAPLYVQAQDSNGDSIVLPCNDNTCTMPGSMRIGLTTPSPTNTDQYVAPATAFLRALITNGTATNDTVTFTISGTDSFETQTLTGQADTSPGAYFVSVPSLNPGTYTVIAEIQQGDVTLYSTSNTFTVVAGSNTVTLNSPTAGNQTTPVAMSATVGGTIPAGATVQFYENGVAITGSNAIPNGSGVATYTWTAASAGTYTITANLISGSGTSLAQSTGTIIAVTGSSGAGVPVTPLASTATMAVSIAPPNTGNPDAGSLPGTLSVSNSGAATYSIPVSIPPGTAGMVPSLSLNYSSQAGNGMLGVGWSVGGLSSIHRCHKTLAQDAISGGTQGRVSFDQTDRLCLDGKRLMLANGTDVDASYWAIGATYSTEIADYNLITAIAGPNGQPAFKVQTKSGHIMYYGTNPVSTDASSLIAAQGRADGQALVWALGNVQDLNGNYYSISYSNSAQATTAGGTGEYLPLQISYGGNTAANQSPDLAVRFVYSPGRPDTTPRYAGGSHNDMVSLLTSIQAFTGTTAAGTGGTEVRELDLNYAAQTSVSSGRVLLQSVQAKALDPNSTSPTYGQLVPLPPTVFNWGQGAAPTFHQYDGTSWPAVPVLPAEAKPPYLGGPKPQVVIWADVNGDGIMDAIVPVNNVNGQWTVEFGTQTPGGFQIYLGMAGGGFAAPVVWPVPSNLAAMTNTLQPAATPGWGFTGDFDGDGSADFYFLGGVVCLSQLKNISPANTDPSQWFSCSNWDPNKVLTDPYTADYVSLDTTGSGRADIVQSITPEDATAASSTRCVAAPASVAGGSGTSPYVFQCTPYPTFISPAGLFIGHGQIKVGDFNGDGRQDLYHTAILTDDNGNTTGYQAIVCLSEDDGFHCSDWGNGQALLLPWETVAQGASLEENQASQIIDVNGDGLTDLWFGNVICYSTGIAPGTVPNVAGGFNCRSAPTSGVNSPPNFSSLALGQVQMVDGVQTNVFNNANLPLTQVGTTDGDGTPKQLIWIPVDPNTNGPSWRLCTPYSCQYITSTDSPSSTMPAMLATQANGQACPTTMNASAACWGRFAFFNNYQNDGNLSLGMYNETLSGLGLYGSSNWTAYGISQNSSPGMDRIVQITNGNGQVSQVDYVNGGTASIYTQYAANKPVGSFTYPQRSVPNPGYIVTDHKEADGQGGWLVQQYSYAGMATDVSGRGSLGFAASSVLQEQSGIMTNSQYRQDWPYSGLVLNSSTVATLSSTNPDGSTNAAGTVISATNNGLTVTPVAAASSAVQGFGLNPPCAICFPYVGSAAVTHQDLGGQDLGSATTTGSYDNYGNLVNSMVVSGPTQNQAPVTEFTTQTVNTYDNNSGLCVAAHGTNYLSRLCSTTVTKTNASTAPGGAASITRATTSTYDANGQLLTQTVEPGQALLQVVTSYVRDTYGNAKSQTQSWTNPQGETGVASRTTATQFDSKGRFPTQLTDVMGLSSYPTYYPATGAKLSLKDANGLTTTWSVDGFGRELSTTTPDNNQTVSYRKQCGTDGNGDATTSSSACPTNAVVMLATDHLNNGARTAVPDVSYLDSRGHVLRKQDWGYKGAPIYVDYTYDTFGHLISNTWPYYAGATPVEASAKAYDWLNRQIEEAHPSWNGPSQTANPCSVPTPANTDTDGCSHTWTQYNGLVHTITNALNQQRIETHDVQGQLVTAVTQANDGITPYTTTQFAHDPFGNLTQTVDPGNNIITIAYDVLGRKADLTDPDLGHIHYDVDPVGRTWRQISPNEAAAATAAGVGTAQAALQASIMQYDAADRMIQRIDPDLASVWLYDAPAGTTTANCAATSSCGKLTESYTAPLVGGIPNANGKTVDSVHTYDSLSRPWSSTKTLDPSTGNIFTTTLTYDSWGRLITTVHQRGSDAAKQFGQRYSSYGYLNLVEREFGTSAQLLWQPTEQDASNRVIQAKLGNGLYDNRTYDAGSGFLAQGVIANTALGWNATASAALSEDYAYDKLGNVSSRTEAWNSGITGGTSFNESFSYDGLNRLRSSTVVGGVSQWFTYDVMGNITSKTGVGSGNYVYPASGANAQLPHAVQSIPGVGSFTYDADGNQLNGNGRTTSWTTFDMPQQIARNGNSSIFTYGPDYERTTQQENNAGTQSKVFYGGAQEVQLDSNNNIKSVKTYWPNGLGVEIDRPTQTTTELNWTHEDRLGSIVAITDSNGNLKEAMGFDAWGSRRAAASTTAVTTATAQVTENTDDKGFTGQEMLDPLELVHLNGRVYDPLVGKFVSGDPHITDPLNGQNYNRYSYVLNNPTNDTDPTGFDAAVPVQSETSLAQVNALLDDGATHVTATEGNSTVSFTKNSDGTITAVITTGSSNGTAPTSQPSAALQPKSAAATGGLKQSRPGDNLIKSSEEQLRSIDEYYKGCFFCIGKSEVMEDMAANHAIGMMMNGDLTEVVQLGLQRAADVALVHSGSGGENQGSVSACGCCFAGDTPVAVKDGTVSIDHIKVGQRVYARDPKTGKVRLKRVTRVFVIHGKQLYDLITEDTNHSQSTTEVTDNHPYWVKDRGWVYSSKLMPGMVLESLKQGNLTVVSVKPTGQVQTTYNLRVEEYHTFFAGKQLVYVHNAGGCSCSAHGNSNASTREQHGYNIEDTHNGNAVVKTGVSGQSLNKDGSSPRANRQVNAWNAEPGNQGRYRAKVVVNVPAGPNSRITIKQWEQDNADMHRATLDPTRHQTP